MTCNVPILLLGFNRPDSMRLVIGQVAKVQPSKIYFAVDGARPDRADEKEKVSEVKNLINEIDWKCEVKTLFREKNLGCGLAVSSAISWFFEEEDYGIILEDDCVPDTSFFKFCEDLLIKYQHDTRVMHICGSNFQKGWKNVSRDSYYFSDTPLLWGWASWSRAWKMFDFELKQLREVKELGLLDHFMFNRRTVNVRVMEGLDSISLGKQRTIWGHQWLVCNYLNSGLSIVPNRNLVENIGFNGSTTHDMDLRLKVPVESMDFPLQHPLYVKRDIISDERYYDHYFKTSYARKLRKILAFIMPLDIVESLALARKKVLWG